VDTRPGAMDMPEAYIVGAGLGLAGTYHLLSSFGSAICTRFFFKNRSLHLHWPILL